MNARDERQRDVYNWVLSSFGPENAVVAERVLRHLEEVIELAQAEDVPKEVLQKIIDYVYGKPKGEPFQEVGGIGTTLLAYCQAKGFSADTAEETEWLRCSKIDPEYFRSRHNRKAAAGIAVKAPELAAKTCATPECGGRVERPPPCKYCEECSLDLVGEEIEQHPLGAVYVAEVKRPR